MINKLEKELEKLFSSMEHFITPYDEQRFKEFVVKREKQAIGEVIDYIDCEVDCIKSGDKLTPQEQCVGIKALHNVKKRLGIKYE